MARGVSLEFGNLAAHADPAKIALQCALHRPGYFRDGILRNVRAAGEGKIVHALRVCDTSAGAIKTSYEQRGRFVGWILTKREFNQLNPCLVEASAVFSHIPLVSKAVYFGQACTKGTDNMKTIF